MKDIGIAVAASPQRSSQSDSLDYGLTDERLALFVGWPLSFVSFMQHTA